MVGSRPARTALAPGGRSLFFVHIPKTAGTTLVSLLERHFPQQEVFPFHHWIDVPTDLSVEKLATYRLFRGHFFYSSLAPLLPEPPAAMTMLRNPVDRIISAYNHTLRLKWHPHHRAINGEKGSLMDYINMPDKAPTRNTQVTFLCYPPPKKKTVMAAQQCYSQDPTAIQDLDRAKEVLSEMSFVGVQEDFDRSLQLLNYTFHWDPIESVESKNVGVYNQKPQSDSDAVNLLHELNRLDFELYYYSRQLFRERYQAMVDDLLWTDFNRRWERQEKPNSVCIDLGGPFFGEGWYEREENPKGISFRWMGLSRAATVHAAVAPSRRMRIEVYVLHAPTPRVLSGLRLFVNGEEVNLRRSRDAQKGQTLLYGDFPGALIQGEHALATVRLEVKETATPHNRPLGVAVSRMEIKPARGRKRR